MQCENIYSEFRRPSFCENNVIKSCNNDVNLKVLAALQKTLKKEGFIYYNIDVKPISTNGGNYLGELYEIDVSGATKDGKKEVNLFMKKIIDGANMALLKVSEAHNRELFFYKELQKVYNELQNEASVPEQERYKVPKTFAAKDPDVIMLENVAKKSYETFNRMDIIPLEFAEACIEQLAKFHGLSFALERKRPDYYNTNIKTMKNLYLLDGNSWDIFFNKASECLLKYLNDDQRKKLEKVTPQLKEILRHFVKNTDDVKCCLCHGDYRPNNIMMKATNGVYTDVIPIDYQIMHYASPIHDFLFFIVVCTDRQFRRDHMTYLKDYYFHQLTEFLKYFDIDVETVYPKMQFEKDFKDRFLYGIVFIFIMCPFLFCPEDDVPDFEKNMENMNFSLVEDCKERVRDLIDDFIEWCGL